jgi:hypothetical protein
METDVLLGGTEEFRDFLLGQPHRSVKSPKLHLHLAVSGMVKNHPACVLPHFSAFSLDFFFHAVISASRRTNKMQSAYRFLCIKQVFSRLKSEVLQAGSAEDPPRSCFEMKHRPFFVISALSVVESNF